MELDSVLSTRLSRRTEWLQIGMTGSPDRVTIDGAVLVNPPVLADAERYITSGSTVLVAKLASGIIVLGRINPTMTGTAAGGAWTALPLINGYGSFGGFQATQYRRIGDEVQIRGLLSGSGHLPFATLPAGYRPLAQILTSGMSGSGHIRIDIGTDGNMVPNTDLVAGYLSLELIRFSTTA